MSKLISKIVVPDSSEATGYALYNIKDNNAVPSSAKGAANGVATLDSSGKVPSSQLPSYVDDVIEGYYNNGKFYGNYTEGAGHDYVEIGGVKWATMNIGAENITDGGLYFQWGDTQGYIASQVGEGDGKKYFGWADYKFNPSGDGSTLTKYNNTDGKTILESSDDAVTAAWGNDWRMPTGGELQNLGNAVNAVYTQIDGVSGLKCTAKTDNTKELFFPQAGFAYDDSVSLLEGNYWSSLISNTDTKYAYRLLFRWNQTNWEYQNVRTLGYPVRGVYTGNLPSGGGYSDELTPETGKIYVDIQTNIIYRWSGSQYVLIGATYELPIASANTLGGVKVGDGLSIDNNGVLRSQLPSYVCIGSCNTDANVLNKEVTILDSNFTVFPGCIIGVKYANTNTASATLENKITLNVNNSGAKHIYYNNQVDPEGTLPAVYGEADKYIYYVYDGTYWVWKGTDYVIDTKNTTGASATLSKIYIVGAESQQAEAQTYSQSTAYIGTDGCLYSDGQKVLTSHQDISGKADASDLQDLETAIKYNNVLGTTISSSERTAWNAKVDGSSVGAANGVASLDANGKVPSTQLPSYVDDVIEAASFALLPEEGEAGKIYVTLDDNKTYRWGGSAYVLISESLAIGTTSGTACEGNDSRLSDSRPASDVYAWAKASTKPTYTLAEVGSISSVVQVDSNLNNQVAPESITGSGNDGKTAHILYVNNGGADYTIVVSTASGYITPDGTGITLTCPQNGYCELSYLNINGTIYVRGL